MSFPRGTAGADRRPGALRRGPGAGRRRARLAAHPTGDKYVTVIIDLTAIRDGTGPARLLDVVEGRSKQAFTAWLGARPQAGRDAVQVVAMDGFTGFKTATTEQLPDAVAVMDLFHVVRLAATRWTPAADGGSRTPAVTAAAPGTRSTAPAAPCTPAPTCSPTKQKTKLAALFTADEHAAVEVTWSVYQHMIAAYGHPDRKQGWALLITLIDSLRRGVPAALSELVTLGRTLHRRADDVLTYFDRPGTSNGPTEAVNGRLEQLRGSALRFRNLTNYIARSLLESGSFRPRLHRPL